MRFKKVLSVVDCHPQGECGKVVVGGAGQVPGVRGNCTSGDWNPADAGAWRRSDPYDAVIPAIAGQAWITGFYQMGMDPTDPYPERALR